jgi:hypothetical protein
MLKSPRLRYSQQKANAKRRGVPFLLTFDEWWAIWQKSGFYNVRGPGGFVMHRICDQGAYEVGNVEIISANENFRHAMNDYYIERVY